MREEVQQQEGAQGARAYPPKEPALQVVSNNLWRLRTFILVLLASTFLLRRLSISERVVMQAHGDAAQILVINLDECR